MAQIQIGSWMYDQMQVNGERITTNVSYKYCLFAELNPLEIFIHRIPYNMYEDRLIPLFETIGVVAQFRLMLNYSGRNRGFGYIIYVDSVDGYRAISYLNNILASSWCRLQLTVSKNTRCLWLGKLSEKLSVDDAIHLILQKVDPYEIYIGQRMGFWCFIIKFLTHRDAAISRKILLREMSDFGENARGNWDLSEAIY